MRQLVHPAYIQELQATRPDAFNAEDDDVETGASPTRGESALDLKQVKYRFFGAGMGVGLVLVTLLWLTTGSRSEASSVTVPALSASYPEHVAPAVNTHRLESEMELMKRIVAGLVESVQTLSATRAGGDEKMQVGELFPYPVKVTTAKAHLRKSADKMSPSIFEVTKDTTLMAFAGTDQWLKVSTPRGEEAWVSRTVVQEQKS